MKSFGIIVHHLDHETGRTWTTRHLDHENQRWLTHDWALATWEVERLLHHPTETFAGAVICIAEGCR